MSTKGKPQRQVRQTQELRRSGASGFHSPAKYSRGSKYPVDYVNTKEVDIDEFFFWEDPLNGLEEDLDIPEESC